MSLRCPSRDTATYPDYDTVGENGIHVSGVTYTESRYRMEYYVNTLKSMDDFLGSLTEALEKYPEPVMLVVYGDHMPSLGLTENDISYGSLYYTEYVIWTNYESEREVRDIESYKLGSLALSKLGIRGNAINRLHNEMSFSDGDFQEKLKLLEYDILYGDNFSTEAFVPDMKFGLHDIRITSCVKRDSLVVYGENFTPFSAVFVNRCEADYGIRKSEYARLPFGQTEHGAGDLRFADKRIGD